ncbi:cell division protein [Zhouia sp. PK063]|uniref:cell division protein n=1 Tax=Zhouia sp. PK063 TaxID=3373602 RepID=UPI00378B2634
MPVIKLQTFIKAKPEIVFNLSCSIDLHVASTKQTNEKAIKGVTTGLINLNEQVTWRAKHFGVCFQLTSKITAFKFPYYFIDEMVKGPFAKMRHEHHFYNENGETKMLDVFEYISPLGWFGALADKIFLENYLHSFLKQRNLVIKNIAENNKWKLYIEQK